MDSHDKQTLQRIVRQLREKLQLDNYVTDFVIEMDYIKPDEYGFRSLTPRLRMKLKSTSPSLDVHPCLQKYIYPSKEKPDFVFVDLGEVHFSELKIFAYVKKCIQTSQRHHQQQLAQKVSIRRMTQIRDYTHSYHIFSRFLDRLDHELSRFSKPRDFRCGAYVINKKDKFGDDQDFVRVQLPFHPTNKLAKVKAFLINSTDLPVALISQLVQGSDPRTQQKAFFWEMGLVPNTRAPTYDYDLFMYKSLLDPISTYITMEPSRPPPVVNRSWWRRMVDMMSDPLYPRKQNIQLVDTSINREQVQRQQRAQQAQRRQQQSDLLSITRQTLLP